MLRSLTLFLFFLSSVGRAQQSSEILLGMKKLNVLGSILYIAAHPDDENTRLIGFFSNEKLYRTGYLSITRGDGGQNLVGDEQGIELGLIRTQELLAARRIDGGEQFFTRAYDFGYSKNPEETFEKWNKDKILADVVWVIRKFRPDVIVTRFPTTGEGGHGHHTASAILANEAFEAAADKNRFPEQLKLVETWQAKRIVWNTFNFGGRNTTSEDQLKVEVGGYNPLLGKSYGEIAAESRSQHKSQGFGATANRGESYEYFKATGGKEATKSLMDEVDVTWKKIKGGEKIQQKINRMIAAFNHQQPQKSVPALIDIYRSVKALPDSYWKNQKLGEIKNLIAACSGLFLDATTNTQFGIQGSPVKINFLVNDRMGAGIVLREVKINGFDTSLNTALKRNTNLVFDKTIIVNNELTQPYWLKEPMGEGYYTVNDLQKIGQPDVDASYEVKYSVSIGGINLDFTRALKYRMTDPVLGEVYQPFVVAPPVELRYHSENIISIDHDTTSLAIDILPNSGRGVEYTLNQEGAPGWMGEFNITRSWNDTSGSGSINYLIEPNPATTTTSFIEARLLQGENVYNKGRRVINHAHIPSIVYFKDARARLINLAVKTEGKKIGYIVGAGDKVPASLEQMGYTVTLLMEKDMDRTELSQFDAIISGVRAYNTNEWLNRYHEKLMDYVSNGGNLIVQYNTSSMLGPVKAKIGPYDFNISRYRVTNENAPVSFHNPQHRVLNFPNKISTEDFEGWIQERSIYHASNWDKEKFETVLTMGDEGETTDEGSLIIAKHGKGNFVYTGIVFFRQLPAGVPGAYRLMANLIAL